MPETKRIYRVYTEDDVEGRSIKTLGYCEGNTEDILAFFDSQKYYAIHLEEINFRIITPSDVKERKELINREHQLSVELLAIKQKLK